MAVTTTFNFTILNGSDPAGHNSINTLINSIDTRLQALSTGLATASTSPGTLSTGQVLRWDGTSFAGAFVNEASLVNSSVTTNKIADLNVTTDKIANDAVTLGAKTSGNYVSAIAGTAGQIASTGATSGENVAHTLSIVSSANLPGTPTVASAPTFVSGSIVSDSKIVDRTYVNAALSYATSGGVTLAGEVTGPTNSNIVANNVIDYDNLVAALQALLVPTGTIAPFAGLSGSKPAGWYICDGSSFASNGLITGMPLYTLLVAAGWSALPDLRGRAIMGAGTGTGLTARTLRDTVGAETLPSHAHTASSNTTGAHEHAIRHTDQGYASPNSGNGQTFIMGNLNGYNNGGSDVYLLAKSAGNHAHTITVDPSGTGTHGVMQPSIVLNYIIKG